MPPPQNRVLQKQHHELLPVQKTGQRAAQHISEELSKTLSSLTAGRRRGYFQPAIQQMGSKDRAAIFRRL